MSLGIWILIFVVTLAVLVKAADYFIEASERIGAALHINPFIIGVTVVALGTSLPELITSIIAVLKDDTAIVIGNVVGSNIANFGLVMATVAIITNKLQLKMNVMIVEMPFFLGSALLTTIMMIDGVFSLTDGIICCLGIIIFIAYNMLNQPEEMAEKAVDKEAKLPMAAIILFLVSGVAIYFSAKYNIEAVLEIAKKLDIGTEVVAQTAVALGTSLPELLVSIAAARRNNLEIAVGNLIGSNIFNSFAVLGIPSLIAPLIVPDGMMTFSVPLMLTISFIFFIMMITNKINRWQGFILMLCYIFFLMTIISEAMPA